MYQSTMYSTEKVTDVNLCPILQCDRFHRHQFVNFGQDQETTQQVKVPVRDLKGLVISTMPDEKPIKSNTQEETKTVKNADGSTTKTITTTITDTFADGSTSTKTKVQTITEGLKPAGAEGKNVTTYKGEDDIKERQKKAKKAKVTSSKDFLKDALKTHNECRAKHGVAPLKLDDDLCEVAQSWANHLAKEDNMEHSQNGFGENVFWTSADKVNGTDATNNWYAEIKDFNWSNVNHQPGTGHFTQVIWKSSEKLGIAYANGKSGTYVVSNYAPAGNFIGQYKENVLPLKK